MSLDEHQTRKIVDLVSLATWCNDTANHCTMCTIICTSLLKHVGAIPLLLSLSLSLFSLDQTRTSAIFLSYRFYWSNVSPMHMSVSCTGGHSSIVVVLRSCFKSLRSINKRRNKNGGNNCGGDGIVRLSSEFLFLVIETRGLTGMIKICCCANRLVS